MTTLSTMRQKPFRSQLGIAAKLYWVAGLSIIAIAILAVASIHFARITEIAASQFNQKGFEAVESSGRLQSLLAQHRQIVESAPAEVDRKRLETSQREFISKSSQLSALLNQLNQQKTDQTTDEMEAQITKEIPALVTAGQEVMFYAYNFAQDKALESSAAYAKIANNLEEKISQYRDHRIRVAQASAATLIDSARSLLFWVSISALAAFFLIGPLGLTITRGVLGRLNRITTYMTRLANQMAAAEVPSRDDRDEVGDMARAVQVFKENAAELSERKRQLEQVNVQLDLALNNMTHGLCMFDSHRRLIICNDHYAKMYKLTTELTTPGTALSAILQYLIDNGTFVETSEETLTGIDTFAANGNGKLVKALQDGRLIVISHQCTADGGWVAIHEDITERQKAEAHVTHLALHDHLTDLPNRVFFRDELEKRIQQLRNGKKFAVLCLDLDRFKGVNDTLGHSIGDKLLIAVVKRLANCVKERDFVARFGGDEFIIIQANLDRPEDGGKLAERIIERLSTTYEIEGQQIDIGASIGVAIAPTDGTSVDQLLKNADLAMYRAKEDGRGAYRFFEPEMDARIQARRALELELRSALVAGQLQLYYQPLVNPRSGEVRCFEALLRWFHPRLGEIPPSEFRVAINLSPIQFRNLNLVKIVFSSLAASGLAASRLELEITESLLLEDDTKTIAMLHEFRSLGIRIVMDDFGTGFSSLNYLRSFPFDKIKIDKSFIHDMSRGGDAVTIVKAIVDLARNLKIDVVAEGVEMAVQLEYLISEGCTEVQGHYFSEPQPIQYFEKVFSQTNGRIEIAA
jgi:diguanylate cyclase (GGDEF)-like protein